MTRSVLLPAMLVAAVLGWMGASLRAAELGSTQLVFEKATPVKKIAASLFLSVVDRSAAKDDPVNRRSVRCAVEALGKRGAVRASGKLALRLQGEAGASGFWRGRQVSATLDDRGQAEFGDEAILELVDEARADGADPELFRIDFDGGKGKKVTRVSVDCLRERMDG